MLLTFYCMRCPLIMNVSRTILLYLAPLYRIWCPLMMNNSGTTLLYLVPFENLAYEVTANSVDQQSFVFAMFDQVNLVLELSDNLVSYNSTSSTGAAVIVLTDPVELVW